MVRPPIRRGLGRGPAGAASGLAWGLLSFGRSGFAQHAVLGRWAHAYTCRTLLGSEGEVRAAGSPHILTAPAPS